MKRTYRRLYIKNPLDTKSERDFIENYYSNGIEQTYNDVECTSKQCNGNCYRSFEDIYALVKTYIPKATKKSIANALIDLLLDEDNTDINIAIFCPDARKIVFTDLQKQTEDDGGYYDRLYGVRDKFKWRRIKGKGKYTFNAILKLAGRNDLINKKF